MNTADVDENINKGERGNGMSTLLSFIKSTNHE